MAHQTYLELLAAALILDALAESNRKSMAADTCLWEVCEASGVRRI